MYTQKSQLKLKSIKIQFCMSCCWWKLHIERLSVMFSLPSDFYKYKDCFTLKFYLQNRGSSNFKTSLFKKRHTILTLRDFVLKQRQIGDEIMIGKLVGFKSIEKKNGRLEIWFSEWIFLKKKGWFSLSHWWIWFGRRFLFHPLHHGQIAMIFKLAK